MYRIPLLKKAATLAALLLATSNSLFAIQLEVFHTFPSPDAPDVGDSDNRYHGNHPFAGLVEGDGGYLYGAANNHDSSDSYRAQGWAYSISPAGEYQGYEGWGSMLSPLSSMIRATDGAFYGTTKFDGNYTAGTVYRFTPNGGVDIIHEFNWADNTGFQPACQLVQGSDGLLYGTTPTGGDGATWGTIFKMTTNGAITFLHRFSEGAGEMNAGLVEGAPGEFYGMGLDGVFKITSGGTYTLFHAMALGHRESSLTRGSDGNLYGIADDRFFRLTLSGDYSLLYSFSWPNDGAQFTGGIVQGTNGAFYGTAAAGGAHDNGTLFKLTTNGTMTVLHHFSGQGDGGAPHGKLLLASDGYFYGTTFYADELNPSGGYSSGMFGTIYRFRDIDSKPTILDYPADKAAPVGGTATFFAQAAAGLDLYYQWQKDGTNLLNGGKYSGVNAQVLTITNLAHSDAGQYSIFVTNSFGTTNSQAATLTIIDNVVAHSSTNVNAGSTVSFTLVTSAQSPTGFQWRRAGTNLNNGLNVTGATTPVLTLSNVLRAEAGAYSVIVYTAAGAVISAPVQLTVNDPFVSQHPVSITRTEGATATFSATVLGTGPITYTWLKRVSTNSFLILPEGAKYSGVNTSTLQVHNVAEADEGNYSLKVQSPYAGLFFTSTEAFLTVLASEAPPLILSGPVSQTVGRFTNVTLSVLATNAGTYQWSKGGDVLASATGSTLTLSNTQLSDSGAYTVTVSNVFGSVSATANIQVVLMPPVITVAPVSVQRLPGALVGFTVTATGPNNTFQWYKGAALMGGRTAATLVIGPVREEDSGDYTVVVSNVDGTVSATASLLVSGAGTYNGLFCQTNGISHDSSGFIAFKLTTNATFSAKITVDGNAFSITGKVGDDGTARKTVSRGLFGKSSLSVILQVTNVGNQIVGTISSPDWTAEVLADYAAFSNTTPTTNNGRYTMLLPGFADANEGPAGYGFVTTSVYTNGRVAQSSYLADGSRPVVIAPLLSQEGTWPLYMQGYPSNVLKTNGVFTKEYQGSVMGWVTLSNSVPTGKLSWNRRGIVSAYYPAGFTNDSHVIGSKYVFTKGERVLAITNGTATLEEGNLTLPVANTFLLTTNNQFLASPGSLGLKMSFSATAGILSGSFSNTTTGLRTIFRGAVLQDQNVAGGYFLGTNQGGLILLEKN